MLNIWFTDQLHQPISIGFGTHRGMGAEQNRMLLFTHSSLSGKAP